MMLHLLPTQQFRHAVIFANVVLIKSNADSIFIVTRLTSLLWVVFWTGSGLLMFLTPVTSLFCTFTSFTMAFLGMNSTLLHVACTENWAGFSEARVEGVKEA